MKKLLLGLTLLTGLSSFSITGPKHRIEGGLGLSYNTPISANFAYFVGWNHVVNNRFDITFGAKPSVALSYAFKYSSVSASGSNSAGESGGVAANGSKHGIGFSINPAVISSEFNIKVPNTKNKFYVGLEAGIGVDVDIFLVKAKASNTGGDSAQVKGNIVEVSPNYIFKVSLGGKINDKVNVAGYLGHGRGIFGLEAGYTY